MISVVEVDPVLVRVSQVIQFQLGVIVDLDSVVCLVEIGASADGYCVVDSTFVSLKALADRGPLLI